MRIGSGWTRKKKDDPSKMLISVALDETFKEVCPQLKNCSMLLSYVDPKDRKSEKAPSWVVNLIKDKDMQNQDVTAAEQNIQADAETQQETQAADDGEIPY